MTKDEAIKALRAHLKKVEWAGIAWTDYDCCFSCGNLKDGIASRIHKQEPGIHKEDCEWQKLMKDTENVEQ